MAFIHTEKSNDQSTIELWSTQRLERRLGRLKDLLDHYEVECYYEHNTPEMDMKASSWNDENTELMRVYMYRDADTLHIQEEDYQIDTKPEYAVLCMEHGSVELDDTEYMVQLSRPFALWTCPSCGKDAEWDGLDG